MVYAPSGIGTDCVFQLNSSPKKPCAFTLSVETYSNHTKRPVGIVMPYSRTARSRIDNAAKNLLTLRDRGIDRGMEPANRELERAEQELVGRAAVDRAL